MASDLSTRCFYVHHLRRPPRQAVVDSQLHCMGSPSLWEQRRRTLKSPLLQAISQGTFDSGVLVIVVVVALVLVVHLLVFIEHINHVVVVALHLAVFRSCMTTMPKCTIFTSN